MRNDTLFAIIASATLSICSCPARAAGADCTAAKTAATLHAKTPFHAVYVVTPASPGAFPTEHHEVVWVGGKTYTLLVDKRWMSTVAQTPMNGFTGPIPGFSDCQSLGSATIRGEAAQGYDIKMESRRRMKMWISPGSGLPMREVVDQDILLVTLDFDYANVIAPR